MLGKLLIFPWVSPTYSRGIHTCEWTFVFLLLICLSLQGSQPRNQKGRGKTIFPPLRFYLRKAYHGLNTEVGSSANQSRRETGQFLGGNQWWLASQLHFCWQEHKLSQCFWRMVYQNLYKCSKKCTQQASHRNRFCRDNLWGIMPWV